LNPNPNFGESGISESGFGESGRHQSCAVISLAWDPL